MKRMVHILFHKSDFVLLSFYFNYSDILYMKEKLILFIFKAVMQENQNGPIKRYYIKYWLLSNRTVPVGEEVIESLDLRVNISDLDPWSWYSVEVYAENDGGEGAHSDPTTVRTMPTGMLSYANAISVLLYSYILEHISHIMRKPVLSVSDQVRHKLGCTTIEDG